MSYQDGVAPWTPNPGSGCLIEASGVMPLRLFASVQFPDWSRAETEASLKDSMAEVDGRAVQLADTEAMTKPDERRTLEQHDSTSVGLPRAPDRTDARIIPSGPAFLKFLDLEDLDLGFLLVMPAEAFSHLMVDWIAFEASFADPFLGEGKTKGVSQTGDQS